MSTGASLDEFTETKLLVPKVLSDRQRGVIQELSRRLETVGRIDEAGAFTEAALSREVVSSTALDCGVALPHARGGAVRQLSLAIGLSRSGIPWDGERPTTVYAVFLCAVPVSEVERYLALVAALTRLTRDGLEELRESSQPEHMMALLSRFYL